MCIFIRASQFPGPYASIFTASVEDAGEAKAETSQIAEQLIILEKLKNGFGDQTNIFQSPSP